MLFLPQICSSGRLLRVFCQWIVRLKDAGSKRWTCLICPSLVGQTISLLCRLEFGVGRCRRANWCACLFNVLFVFIPFASNEHAAVC